MKKVNARICKIQSFYLSHHSQREVIIEKLEENSYAYLKSPIDRSREKIFDDEITDFISNSTKESKWFNHCPGVEYLSLSKVHTCDLDQSFNLQVRFLAI